MSTIIEHKGIATVLASFRLAVPKHQRSFEWTKDEIGELLEDIGNAFNRQREEYFLGSIVVMAEGGSDRYQVLDGQQRLATISLLSASVADAFAQRGEKDAAEAVRQLLSSYDIDQGAHSPHLRLNQEDDSYFRGLLQTTFAPPQPGAPGSHRLLYEGRLQTQAWVAERSKADKAGIQWLRDIVKYLRESVRVIYFGVADDSNAYRLFETLNDRGLDLSIADLLKNYLLGRAGDQEAAILAQWTRAFATLKAYGYEKRFTVFLRQYWASKYEVVREKDLYRNVKSRITATAHVADFADEMAKNSHFYTALLSADHEYWEPASEATRDRLRTLELLGLEQFRPMLLPALAHMEPKLVETVIELLVAWNVRLIIVGGLGGGVMEAKYAELGRGIRAGEIKSIQDLAAKAKAFVPGDSAFKDQFAVATVSKVALARYYLRTLELFGPAAAQAEKVPNPTLTLEHVLPEKPGKNYPSFSEEDRKLYTRRIGNLVLLTHKMNSDLKSAPFPKKAAVYKASSLALTQHVGARVKWDPSDIDERQRELAALAVKAWPLRTK